MIMILPFSREWWEGTAEMNVACAVLLLRSGCGGRNDGQAQKRISKELGTAFLDDDDDDDDSESFVEYMHVIDFPAGSE